MKIGLVSPYDLNRPGGVQNQVHGLARHLSDLGEEVVVVGPGVGKVGRAVALPANRSTVPVSLDPRSVFNTRRMVLGVDVVHIHEPFVPLVGWGALRTGKPTIATFHADPSQWTRRLYRTGSRLGRWWLGPSTVTAVSPVAASALPAAWGPPRIIPNAIDTGSYQVDAVRSPRRVVFLGRDDPRKGLDVVLRAWPMVQARHPDSELLVVGAKRSQPPAGVSYTGRVSEQEKRSALASGSVYVAPNLGGESFGIVLAEAMAAGCAVVASDLPAFRSVVGRSGRFVTPGSSQELSRAIVQLLEDPSSARRLGQAARKEAKRFDWCNVVDQYRDCYRAAFSELGDMPDSQ